MNPSHPSLSHSSLIPLSSLSHHLSILIPTPLHSPSKTHPTPPQRSSYTILPFLHDTDVPFGDSSQGGLPSKQEREEHIAAYLEEWDTKWKEMKKE
jgi:hypothetical protein